MGGQSDVEGLQFSKIILTSNNLATDNNTTSKATSTTEAPSQAGETVSAEPVNCQGSMDIYRFEGSCITPLSMSGYSWIIDAVTSTDNNPDTGSARIAGVSGAEDEEGSMFSGAEFDFSQASAFTGYNELFQIYESPILYDYISAELVYERVKFKLKGQYVTLLIPSYGQPFAQSAVMDECNVPEDERTQRFANADLLPGMSFERADYLFCVKDTNDAVCNADDYQWYDEDNSQLVATRPSNPRQQSYLAADSPNCSQNEERGTVDIGLSGIKIGAQLDQKFKLYADFSHGVNSHQWPDEPGALGEEPDPDHLVESTSEEDVFEQPYLIYYYETATGAQTIGTNLELTFDFDVSNMIYVEGYNEEQIAQASLDELLGAVYTKHDWVFHKKAQAGTIGFSVDQYSSMGVSTTIDLSGGTNRPTLEE